MALSFAKRALFVKVEGTPGTYDQPSTSTDRVSIDDLSFTRNPETQESNEATGTFDQGETDIGGFKPQITGTAKLRGAASAGTAPNLARILRACGMKAAAGTVVPASGTSAIKTGSGTTTGFTIDISAETDWSNVDGAYIGRVVRLSVNPSTPRFATILDYQVTGNDAVVTLAETMASTLGNTTEVEIMPDYMLWPTSVNADIPSLSIEGYEDLLRKRYFGSRGTFGIRLDAGRRGDVTFTLDGSVYDDEADVVSSPAPSAADLAGLPAPPSWRNGRAFYNKVRVGCLGLELNLNHQVGRPRDPNELHGFGLVIPGRRNIGGTIRFNADLVASRAAEADLKAGARRPFAAMLDTAASAGNRISILIPRLKHLDLTREDAEQVLADSIPFQAVSYDDGMYVTFF